VFTHREAQAANLYDSPSAPLHLAANIEPQAYERGSVPVIVIGGVLFLFGYICSNVFAIADLYHVGLGTYGEFVPSPIASAFKAPLEQWLIYALAAAAVVAGCVLIGSQNYHPAAVVCFILCPLMGLVFAMGMPLRSAWRHAVPAATAYVGVGTCLAGAGVIHLMNLYGRLHVGFEPIVASLLLEGGLAMVIGGFLKLAHSGAFSPPPAEAEAVGDAVPAP
jgi:hypothetical protein